jgi:hypothetical protein
MSTRSATAAYVIATVWLVFAALAVVEVIFAANASLRWTGVAQCAVGLFLGGMYLVSARHPAPRGARPSTSRWAGGRPGERWH